MGVATEWGGVVRLTLPDGWTAGTEEHEGRPTAVFRPPSGPGVLRLVTDRLAAGGGPGAAEATVREAALRFLRPDDPRMADRVLEDRVLEDRTGGGIVASGVLTASADGRADTHYLWMIAEARDGEVPAAMFGCVLPAEADGTQAAADTLAALDRAIREAVLLAGPG